MHNSDAHSGVKAMPGQKSRWLIDYPRAVPVLIFLAVAAITALSVFAIERGEGQREEALMSKTGQEVASALERRGDTSSSYLRAGAALFATAERVDPELFQRFVSELRLDADYRGAEGIGWAEAIAAKDVGDFAQRVSGEAMQSFMVRPTPTAATTLMVPVTFLQPDTERSRRALGFDMYSEPVRRAAMDEAERLVRPTASGQIVLVQEGESETPGFLIYMPVFGGSETGRQLRGFVYSPFNAQDFLESALELASLPAASLQLYDGAPQPANLLANYGPTEGAGQSLIQTVRIANRDMTMVLESSRGNSLSLLSMLTLLFGLAVASLLMLVARLLTQQAIEDEASLNFLEQQNSIRNSLTRELNHRVKNTLANVLSIVSLTRRRANDVDDFADGLEGRIRALSATHDLLTQSDWGTTPVREVLEAEMRPYLKDSDTQLVMDGPDLDLAPNDALSLGLAIHELATNAAKFGALSQVGGCVSINWERESEAVARLDWRERGGPVVMTQRRRGFGTELIEKIVAHELRHPVQLDFDPAGVRCTLRIPVRSTGEFKLRAAHASPPTPA